MKTPIVQETRRAGNLRADAHRRPVALLARSLVAAREPRDGRAERTRSERRAV